MYANTKQMRFVIRTAIAKVGAVSGVTYTDMDRSFPTATRYVGFYIKNGKAAEVVAEARKICATIGYTNTVRQGKKDHTMVRTTAEKA